MESLKGIVIAVSVIVGLVLAVLCIFCVVYGFDLCLPVMGVIALFAGIFYAAVIACVLIDIARKR